MTIHVYAIIRYETSNCCIFRPVFGCCTLQSLDKICFLNVFFCIKKYKNEKKMRRSWAKYCFSSMHLMLVEGLIFRKTHFQSQNMFLDTKSYEKLQICVIFLLIGAKPIFLGIKLSTSIWVQPPNTLFFLNFASIFLFFLLFYINRVKNGVKVYLARVWSAQHPNVSQNIQQVAMTQLSSTVFPKLICCGNPFALVRILGPPLRRWINNVHRPPLWNTKCFAKYSKVFPEIMNLWGTDKFSKIFRSPWRFTRDLKGSTVP